MRLLSALWRVDPAPLFDRKYYLSLNPDVVESGVDPLFHFVWCGGSEGRQPHPLFDSRYYLDRYPDVARSGHNPLFHFLRFGGHEARSPHQAFDSAFYLASNSDVAATKTNPLVHFVRDGAAEGRLPHPDFSPELYYLAHPDVAVTNLHPVRHFAEHGAAEGRFTSKIRLRPEDFLPVSGRPPAPESSHEIDVIIPVYKGLSETMACLASVLSSSNTVRFRVVVVNDCTPEPQLADHLRQLKRDGRITLIENSENLGFVRSVNVGMLASGRDVVLLNSDTMVSGDWLDRLSACAYRDAITATVTPFSNNATICSYPIFCIDNRFPPSLDTAALDAVFASVNRGRSVDIPTAVGFCMYIRRDCLAKIGLFDAETFGAGYGEENDFCMRATARGWKNKLACDVFVYHVGSVSFDAVTTRQKAAMGAVIARYPSYPELVRRHVEADPAFAFRIAVTAKRIRESGKRVFLSVVHALGGGVAEHVGQLAGLTEDAVFWLTLKPSPPHFCVLECSQEEYRFSLKVDMNRDRAALMAVLAACGVERAHLHHFMGHDSDLTGLIQELNLPFDYTVHDYYAICPQVTLSDERGRYCSEPDEKSCNRCIEERPQLGGAVDISSWRLAHSWAFLRADRVLAPSADTAARIARYYPKAPIVAAEHAGMLSCGMVRPQLLAAEERLLIAVLGTQSIHKGFELLRECAEAAANHDLPIEFVLVGRVEAGIKRGRVLFRETGRYEPPDLPAILERAAPHLVWFPTRVPETFSYTLSACLELGLPVAAHDTGAFPERLARRPWSWIVGADASASEWTDFFLRVRRDHFTTGEAPVRSEPRERARPDFYPAGYLATTAVPRPSERHRARSNGRGPIRIAAAVASTGRQIQACGYVRIVQPLTHPAVADALQLTLCAARDLLLAEADVVLVQRVAIQDMEIAEKIVDACRRRGSRLVFETDDDLFHIPPEHPESEHYLRITAAAKWLAKMADAVITSTEALRLQMLPFNANSVLLPNFLDERLWLSPYRRDLFDPDEIRVLYAGTLSHREDLEFLGAAVRRLPGKWRKKIGIDVVGAANEDADWFHAVPVPPAVAASYPRFVEWIRARNNWHWGVAPLLDTPFNRSKSALKFFDYSALDLASICSDMSVYRDAVQPGQTGILAANDPAVWSDALEMVLGDEALWNRLRNNARNVVRENTIGARAAEIKKLWASLVNDAQEEEADAETAQMRNASP